MDQSEPTETESPDPETVETDTAEYEEVSIIISGNNIQVNTETYTLKRTGRIPSNPGRKCAGNSP